MRRQHRSLQRGKEAVLREHGAADGGIPSRLAPRGSLAERAAERRPSGRPGRAGTDERRRAEGGALRRSRPGGGPGVSEPRAGLPLPTSQPRQLELCGEAWTRGRREEREGGGETRRATSFPREPKPTRPRPSAGCPHRHSARASHPALAAVPARVGVGPVHGERRVAARHLGARAGNFPGAPCRRAASCGPCSGSPAGSLGQGAARAAADATDTPRPP